MALRDNERAAEAYGLHATRVRLVAFALSGALAGLAGCLCAHQQQGLDPDPLAPFQNLLILTYVIIGGVTTPLGAIIGAAYWIGLGNLLPVSWQILASGLGVLIVLLMLPSGLGGLFYRLRDRWLATRRSSSTTSRRPAWRHALEPEAPLLAAGSPDAGRRADPDRGGGLMKLKKPPSHPRRGCSGSRVAPPSSRSLVLFGLNAVDELDRTAFGVLLPEHPRRVRPQPDRPPRAHRRGRALVRPRAAGADRALRPTATTACASRGSARSRGRSSACSPASRRRSSCSASRAAGSGIGKAVVDPTHNSLLADYYDIPSRPRVFSFHRAANAVGAFIGPLIAGLLAYACGWRWPFIVFAFPTLVLVVLAWRLREPVRGVFERRAAGASEEAAQTEEAPPSFAESWRIVWKIESLRRIWYSLPFLAASLIGFVVARRRSSTSRSSTSTSGPRGVVAACVEPAQLVGLILGARIATR